LNDNSKSETESILDLLNALDKSKIIEIGNKILKQNNQNDAKNDEFAKLLSTLDDVGLKSSSDNQEAKSSNNIKKFSFQNVLQQASNVLNNVKPSLQSSFASINNSVSGNQLLNSGLNIPLPILSNIETGLESARNLTDISLSQLSNLINSNNNLVETAKTSTLKPNNNIALDQISNIIGNLNTNDQASK
jgi:hypothetical protein